MRTDDSLAVYWTKQLSAKFTYINNAMTQKYTNERVLHSVIYINIPQKYSTEMYVVINIWHAIHCMIGHSQKYSLVIFVRNIRELKYSMGIFYTNLPHNFVA